MLGSKTYSVASVSSASLTRPCNLYHLTTPKSIVARDRIGNLYSGKLSLFQAAKQSVIRRQSGRAILQHTISAREPSFLLESRLGAGEPRCDVQC